MKVIGIYYDVFFQKKPLFLSPKLWEVICHRANPRSFAYMKEVFEAFYPEGEIVLLENLPSKVDKVILLYPDAIGLGQGSIESRLRRNNAPIFILNGRRRHFELTNYMRNKLRVKRFLESSFLCEVFFTPFIIILGMLAALKDRIMGRT